MIFKNVRHVVGGSKLHTGAQLGTINLEESLVLLQHLCVTSVKL